MSDDSKPVARNIGIVGCCRPEPGAPPPPPSASAREGEPPPVRWSGNAQSRLLLIAQPEPALGDLRPETCLSHEVRRAVNLRGKKSKSRTWTSYAECRLQSTRKPPPPPREEAARTKNRLVRADGRGRRAQTRFAATKLVNPHRSGEPGVGPHNRLGRSRERPRPSAKLSDARKDSKLAPARRRGGGPWEERLEPARDNAKTA